MADVELYTIACGSEIWRYTNAILPVTLQGYTWTSAVIKRSAIEMSTDLEKSTLTLTVPLTLPLLDRFRPVAPLRKVFVAVQRLQRGDATAATLWSGVLGNLESGPHTATLTLQSRYAAMSNLGLRRRWQKLCPHTLYSPSPACGASRVQFRVTGPVTGLSGRVMRIAAAAGKPNGYFVGGYAEWVQNGNVNVGYVIDHTADSLTLLQSPSSLSIGASVSLYPGCDRSPAMCDGRFGNIKNYGGQMYLPTVNPFGVNKIF